MPTVNKKPVLGAVLLASMILSCALAFNSTGAKIYNVLAMQSVSANSQPTPLVGVFKQRIRVWIHGNDVRPKVIHAWPGRVLLTCENETGSDTALIVDRVVVGELNDRTSRVPTAVRRKRATQEVTLVPGEYVFYEESRPAIRGKIIVEPREQR